MSLLPMFIKEFNIGGMNINIEQEGNVGIGGMVWDAAFIVGRFLAKNKDIVFKNVNSIIELGSGTGLVGIAVALMFPDIHITITDHRSHLSLIETNVQCNNLKNVTVRELDWFKPENIGKFDLVIGSDLVYDPDLFEPLLNAIDIVSSQKSLIFLSNEVRMSRDFDIYKKAQERGWQLTMIPLDLNHEEDRNPESPVIRFVKTWD